MFFYALLNILTEKQHKQKLLMHKIKSLLEAQTCSATREWTSLVLALKSFCCDVFGDKCLNKSLKSIHHMKQCGLNGSIQIN